MNVHVDQARTDDQADGVDHFRARGFQPPTHGRDQTVFDENVPCPVDILGRADDPPAFKQ